MSMAYLSGFMKIVLAFVFILSGVAKASDLKETTTFIKFFGLQGLSKFVAVLFVSIELILGLLLLTNAYFRFGVILSIAMLLFFIGLAVYVMSKKKAIRCNCFGPLMQGLLGRTTVIRNTALIAALAVSFLVHNSYSSQSLTESVVTGVPILSSLNSAGEVALFPVLVVFSIQLMLARHRKSEVADPISTQPESAKLKPGMSVPDFTVFTPKGHEVSSELLKSKKRRAVLFFMLSGCEPCMELLPEIVEFQHTYSSDYLTLVISDGDHSENVRKAGKAGVANIVTQRMLDDASIGEVSEAFGVDGFPCHIFVDENFRIAKEVSYGKPDISFIESTLSSSQHESNVDYLQS